MHNLKLASAAELSIVRSIALRTWPTAYAKILSRAQLEYMLALMYSEQALDAQRVQGHNFVLIASDSEWEGFASFEQCSDGGSTGRLHKIYVLPSSQGQGFGKALLHWVIAQVREAGAERLELNVNRFNEALRFYEAEGFRIVRDEVIDIGNGFVMDDHVLVLEL